MRNLFYGFIREEQRQASRRAREHGGHDSSQHRLQRGSVPAHIDISNASSHGRSRASSDVSVRSSSSTTAGPRSATGIILSPNMLPAVSPAISAAPRSSPLMTPMIPLHSALRDSGLATIPQSPNFADATPMPISHGLRDSQRSDNSVGPAVPPSAYGTVSNDYFSQLGSSRRPSVSSPGGPTTPDDFSGWGGKSISSGGSGLDTGPLVTPSTPTMGSIMGRLNKAFSKTKRQPSENAGTTPQGGSATSTSAETPAEVSARLGLFMSFVDELCWVFFLGYNPSDQDSCPSTPCRTHHPALVERSTDASVPPEHLYCYLGGGAVRLAHAVSWTCLYHRLGRPATGGSDAVVVA